MRNYYLCLLLVLYSFSCNKNPVDCLENSNEYGSIQGDIIDKYSYPIKPISSAKIYIFSSSRIDTTYSDSSGNFIFQQLPVGLYIIKTTADDYDTIETIFSIQNDKYSTITIELTPVYQFELGTVLVGFTDTTNVETVFYLLSGLGLTIKSLQGFDHQSNLPTDSIQVVRDILKSKSYLSQTDYTIFVNNGVIRIVGGFVNLDSTKIIDWYETKTQLKIISVPSSYRSGEIHTQNGKEVVWVRALRCYSFIRWLELNYYIPIYPW